MVGVHTQKYTVIDIEESGEQRTVVFARIVTGLAGGGDVATPPPSLLPTIHIHSLAGSVTMNAKTTVQCSPSSSTSTAIDNRKEGPDFEKSNLKSNRDIFSETFSESSYIYC